MKLLTDNDVAILDEHRVYVHFTKVVVSNSNKVRIRCDLRRLDDDRSTPALESVSFLCERGKDYRQEVRLRAVDLFRKKLRKNNPELYTELFREDTPFEQFYKTHFANIAQLHGWMASTIRQYEQTIKGLLPRIPNKLLSDLTAADFDAVIDEHCRDYQKNKGEIYSESRIAQFVVVLHAIMEYARVEYGLSENVLKYSKYYDSTQERTTIQPFETLLEKRLRPRSLDVAEQQGVAENITQELCEEKNPLAIGTGIQMLTGLRPSEVCGLQWRSLRTFTKAGYENRSYFLIYTKVDDTGKASYGMKTPHAYRAIPVCKVLQAWLNICHVSAVKRNPDLLEMNNLYIVTKDYDGSVPVKPKTLCGHSAALIRKHANADFRKMQIPVELGEDGEWIPQEKNLNAYQFRRNFGSVMLSVLGRDYHASVEGFFGHKLSNNELRRWLLYHEDKLIKEMEEMDKWIVLPTERSDVSEMPWLQPDPRKTVHQLNSFGSYNNVPEIRLSAQPHSETDCVTVRLVVNGREPADKIKLFVQGAEEKVIQLDVDAFLTENINRDEPNLLNAYWDEVFNHSAKSANRAEAEPEDFLVEEEESYEDSEIFTLTEEDVPEIYEVDEDEEMDEDDD